EASRRGRPSHRTRGALTLWEARPRGEAGGSLLTQLKSQPSVSRPVYVSVDTRDLPLPLEAQLTLGPLTPGLYLAPLGTGAFGLLQCLQPRLPVGLFQFQLGNIEPEICVAGLGGQLTVELCRRLALTRLPPKHAQTLATGRVAG